MHPPAHNHHEADVHYCEVEDAFADNVNNICNLGKSQASKDVQPPVEPHSKDDAAKSPSTHGDMHVGPAFHIPMTQGRTLQDLPVN